MLQSRLFWKLTLSYVLLVFLTCGVLSLLVLDQWTDSLRRHFEQSVRTRLATVHGAVAAQPHLDDSSYFVAQVAPYKDSAESQLTFLDPRGRVLADSRGQTGDLSSEWEVVTALQGGVGQDRRKEAGKEMLWVARPLPGGGVVRLGVSTAGQELSFKRFRRRVAAAASIGVLLAILLGWWVARWLRRPVLEMRSLAEGIRRGEYRGQVKHLPHNEIGQLGETFNRVQRELSEKMESLVREESHLRAILASMVEGVVAVDQDDVVLFSNPAARQLLQQQEAFQLTGSRLWEWTELRELAALAVTVREEGRATARELEFTGANNEVVTLDVRGAPFEQASGVLLVFHDVTSLRRLERVRQDFVANVSHELKTPLTSIKGYIETLLGGALRDENHNERFLRKINKHVVHLTNLVTDLLHLGRIEGGGLAIEIEPVEWNEVVREVLSRHKLLVEERGLTLEFVRSPRPVLVKGDVGAMTQIADNLVANAVKYSETGGTIVVSVSMGDGLGCLEVRDSGVGIPEPDLRRIFERFYRVDKARSDVMGGTGLGLSIVKHLVSTLGGEIRVESRLGEGSCFRVGLPLVSGVE